jgi:two-component system, response regulator PdtaR
MRVLIVEDENLIAWHYAAIVETSGHIVFGIAGSARAARALCSAELPDLALVDLVLTDGLTGLDLAKELAEAGVLIWFVTANETSCKAHTVYAIGCLPKPVKAGTLEAALAITDSFNAGHPLPKKPPRGAIFYGFNEGSP